LAFTILESKTCELHSTFEVIKVLDGELFKMIRPNINWTPQSQPVLGDPYYNSIAVSNLYPYSNVESVRYNKNIPSVGEAPYRYANYDSKQQSWSSGQAQCVVSLESQFNDVEFPPPGVTRPVPQEKITNPPSTFAPTAPLPDIYPQVWVGIGVGITVVVTLACVVCLLGGEETQVTTKTSAKIADF
jgi:hypothetical protein